jgi:hypothetical protein
MTMPAQRRDDLASRSGSRNYSSSTVPAGAREKCLVVCEAHVTLGILADHPQSTRRQPYATESWATHDPRSMRNFTRIGSSLLTLSLCSLGPTSAGWAIQLGSHLGLTLDSLAARCIPESTKEEVIPHPKMEKLKREDTWAKREAERKFGSFRKAQGSAEHNVLTATRRKSQATKNKVTRDFQNARRKAHFANVSTQKIERQRTGQAVPASLPQTGDFAIRERRVLHPLLCRNDNATDLAATKVHERRLEALRAMCALCGRRDIRPWLSRLPTHRKSTESEPLIEEGELYGLLLCSWCFYDDSLPGSSRRHRFSRAQQLRDHIETCHLRHICAQSSTFDPRELSFGLPYRCPFPRCGYNEASQESLENHIDTHHDFFCHVSHPSKDNDFGAPSQSTGVPPRLLDRIALGRSPSIPTDPVEPISLMELDETDKVYASDVGTEIIDGSVWMEDVVGEGSP